MSKHQIRFGTVIFGLFTAMVIIFSQLFYFQGTQYRNQEIKKETRKENKDNQQADDQANDIADTFISQPSGSLPASSAEVELNHESVCILEIVFEETDEHYSFDRTPVYVGKFLHTLFRTVISTNAP